MVGEKTRISIKSAILGIVHIHNVKKLPQQNIAYEVQGGDGSKEVSLVEFNSLIMERKEILHHEVQLSLLQVHLHLVSMCRCCLSKREGGCV